MSILPEARQSRIVLMQFARRIVFARRTSDRFYIGFTDAML
jgi:hypothetical protein